MKISILCSNLSTNCLGRAYILAKVLQRHYAVDIVGPVFQNEIWYPVADDDSVNYRYVRVTRQKKAWVGNLLKFIEGDVIYASKPLMPSFGLGLLKKFFQRKPLVLDIDDWERGLSEDFYRQLSIAGRIKNFFASFYDYASYWNILFLEKVIGLADALTVSNSFLKQRFGGILVPHGRDVDTLDPARYDRNALRAKWGLTDRKVIAYIGTPRIHKGIDDLLEAVSRVTRQDIILLLVGMTEKNRALYSLAQQKLGKERLRCLGEQPMAKIGEFLAISDMVVIPQKQGSSSQEQTPAKIFDAMAMAKPIIASAICDVPDILNDCGVVVPSGNAQRLSDAINHLLTAEEFAKTLGVKAREKCISQYSWNSMEQSLLPLFSDMEKRGQR